MVVLASNDRKELMRDIDKELRKHPGAVVGPITKTKDGWWQVTIQK